MSWLHRLIDRLALNPSSEQHLELTMEEERAKTQGTIMRTLAFGLEAREAKLEIIEHSTLVAVLCSSLGRRMQLSEADLYILETAAQLHEVGMFTVPPSLLMRSTPLTAEELEQVRAQAKISADLAATMHHPRVARLIEYQYEDYTTLMDRMPEADLLLAGILRVSDVVAAVTRPRPYQQPLPLTDRASMLENGAGTRFHPDVVRCALQLSESSEQPI